MTASQKVITKRIIRARDNIRRKWKALKMAQAGNEFLFNTQLHTPLQNLLTPRTRSRVTVDTQTAQPHAVAVGTQTQRKLKPVPEEEEEEDE